MKLLVIALLALFTYDASSWLTDFNEAQKMAKEKHELILLNFSGSDWCGPCIRLHKEIFDSGDFMRIAREQLILVNADFPRLKKNQLPKAQQEQNEMLADKYNAAGNFPSTVLLNAEGKVLKVWDGFPKQGATAFIDEINTAINDNK
ncbi:MAG TPA: thioredoxin family protein [Agriterribacter sp.]|nr:thioredoxin family protein [Agriterribacter sp.]